MKNGSNQQNRDYIFKKEALQMKVDILTTGSLDDDFLTYTAKDEVMLYMG